MVELWCAYRDVDGSGQASCAYPGVNLAQLPLLILGEARLVFLHAPQGLTVLSQHSLHVPVVQARGKRVTENLPSGNKVLYLD